MRPSAKPAFATALLGLLSAALLSSACEPAPPAGTLRLIEKEPEAVFSAAELAAPREVFAWSFREPAELEPWRPEGIDGRPSFEGGVLELRSLTADPQLARSVDLEAGAVQTIVVESWGGKNRTLQLFWAGPGEYFGEERSLVLRSTGRQEAPRLYEFQLWKHPEWRGRIVSLRLDPTAKAGETVRIARIVGLAHRLDEAAAARLAPTPWKVELDHELRSARLALPGHPIEWPLTVPAGAQLRFGYGALRGIAVDGPGGAGAPPRLRVSLRRRDETPEVLFERRLEDAAGGAVGRWADAAVDLAAYAGQEARLSFEAVAENPGGGFETLPAWGHPEVVPGELAERPPNVVLISLDTLRADHLSLNGYRWPTTPNVDAWAKRTGVSFSDAIASSPWTLPSHVSMLTGIEALHHGVSHARPVPGSLTTLAELLRRAGYATVAVTGGGYLSSDYGFHQGFDVYHYWPVAAIDDEELTTGLERTLGWLDRLEDRPFFLFFHTFEIHAPYRAHQPYYRRFGGSGALADAPEERLLFRQREEVSKEDGFLRFADLLWREASTAESVPLPKRLWPDAVALYDSGIAYTDSLLGDLFGALESRGLDRETIVVLTSDHGESFGEHGLFGHIHLYDDNLRVPLVIAYPAEAPAGRTVDAQVRSVDVLPTVLELAGLPVPEGLDGVSLVPLMHGGSVPLPPALSSASTGNRGVSLRAGGELKYIYSDVPWEPLRGAEQLFSLRRDPGELEDLAAGGHPELEELRARIQRALASRPGLRLRLENRGDGLWSGTIAGEHLRPTAVKTSRMPCDCVEWADVSDVRFEVPPRTSYELLFEPVAAGPLEISGTWRSQDRESYPFDLELDVDALDEPMTLTFDGRGWTARRAEEPQAVLTLAWQGAAGASEKPPTEENEQLREQLRALGYLE